MLGATLAGTLATGWRTPSTRQRTSRPSLPGCQCTSLAPAFCASASTRSTTSVAYREPAGSSGARISVMRLVGMEIGLLFLPLLLRGRGGLACGDDRPRVHFPVAFDPLEPDGERRTFREQDGALLGDLLGAENGDLAPRRDLDLVPWLEPLELQLRGGSPHLLDHFGGRRLAPQQPDQLAIGERDRAECRLVLIHSGHHEAA